MQYFNKKINNSVKDSKKKKICNFFGTLLIKCMKLTYYISNQYTPKPIGNKFHNDIQII